MTEFLSNPVVWYGASALAYAALGIGLLVRGGQLLRQNMLLIAIGGIAWSVYFAATVDDRAGYHLDSATFFAEAFFMLT